jgi:Tfp pilus assembly protein PilF
MALEQNSSVRSRLVKIRDIERSQGLAVAERALVDFIREEAASSPEAFLALARMLTKGKRYDDALRAAQKARALAPLEVEPLLMAGLVHLRKREPGEAGELFAKALQLDPKSARATLGAAAVKLAEEDYPAAEELCDRVLEIDPEMDRAHELAARVQMKQGKTGEAIAELQTLITKSPDNKRAVKAYLGLAKREGKVDEALQFVSAEAAAHPGDRQRQRLLSVVAARAGNAELATAQYRDRIDAGTAKITDRLRFAMALIEAGSLDEARATIAQLGNQAPLKPIQAKLEGDIALKSGDTTAAIESYQSACRLARIEMLPQDEADKAENPVALAKLWKHHVSKLVLAAARSRRASRAEA